MLTRTIYLNAFLKAICLTYILSVSFSVAVLSVGSLQGTGVDAIDEINAFSKIYCKDGGVF